MSDVTVIGLGEMGSALARAFLAGGKAVTVWNRTPAKAALLVQKGAVVAATPAEAVAASPVVVICLTDYAAASGVLGDADNLAGRLVVQLTSGTPKQARALADWVEARGAAYLDGAIGAWPRQIGGPEAGILFSGDEALLAAAEPQLSLLAGTLSHVGADIGHAKAFFNAGLAYFAGHWIGFSHGAAICEAEGLSVETFGEMMAGMSPGFGDDMRHMGRVIAQDRFGDPESTVKSVTGDVRRLVELSGDLKIGADFPTFATAIFQRAVDAGYGAEEHAAVVKVLRKA